MGGEANVNLVDSPNLAIDKEGNETVYLKLLATEMPSDGFTLCVDLVDAHSTKRPNVIHVGSQLLVLVPCATVVLHPSCRHDG